MKELTTQESCKCCSIGHAYKTPWCELLKEFDHAYHVMNFWYKLDWLQREIEKRSSYLGKFRRTEEAQHLLDLIAMTKDEEDLFIPFANAAMADVYDELERYTPRHGRSYLWNEDIPVVNVTSEQDEFHVNDLVEYNGRLYIAWLDNIIEPITIKFHNEAAGYDVVATRDGANDSKGDKYPCCFSTEDSVMYYCEEAAPSVGNEVFVAPNAANSVGAINAVSGGWDGIPIEEKLVETFDWRHSIHFLLAFPKDWHINMGEPLDTAIFEALVARIIYKWLEYAYPDEAPRYLKDWNEGVENIRRRCKMMYGQQIVKRIPRIF